MIKISIILGDMVRVDAEAAKVVVVVGEGVGGEQQLGEAHSADLCDRRHRGAFHLDGDAALRLALLHQSAGFTEEAVGGPHRSDLRPKAR